MRSVRMPVLASTIPKLMALRGMKKLFSSRGQPVGFRTYRSVRGKIRETPKDGFSSGKKTGRIAGVGGAMRASTKFCMYVSATDTLIMRTMTVVREDTKSELTEKISVHIVQDNLHLGHLTEVPLVTFDPRHLNNTPPQF